MELRILKIAAYIWGTSLPNILRQQPMHSDYVTTWCGFTAEFILGPFLFETLTPQCPKRCSVTSQGTVNFLTNRPFLLYMNENVCKPLFLCKMNQLLTLDVKSKYCLVLTSALIIGGIRTLPDLKASIIRHVAEIPRELLRATIENSMMRFQHVIEVNGEYIENIMESFSHGPYSIHPKFHQNDKQNGFYRHLDSVTLIITNWYKKEGIFFLEMKFCVLYLITSENC
ncbi:UNVERIFIED_CONTAM: hypothetical protein NCL1_40335 [Trichonephila clavipes]